MVPEAGIEPARLAAGDFESPASTNFTTRAGSARQSGAPGSGPPLYGVFSRLCGPAPDTGRHAVRGAKGPRQMGSVGKAAIGGDGGDALVGVAQHPGRLAQ